MSLSKSVNKILIKLKSDKRLAIIVVIGIVGILLLTMSELIPSGSKQKEEKNDELKTDETYSSYEENIESRLKVIVSSINGAGNSKVMVTLDSGDENIYAAKEKSSVSANENSSEKEYVIVNKDGEDNGLLLKVVEPEVRGVAIVCEGADNAVIRQEIINTVTAVLGISSNRVSIAKMKNNNGG